MALTKSNRTPQSSTTCTAGGTQSGSSSSLNYGVSGVAKITNGGSAPTTPCGLYLDFSPDNGTTWYAGPLIGVADVVASSVTLIPYALGIGAGGDWTHYRPRFTGNTGQSVTVEAQDSTTTAL